MNLVSVLRSAEERYLRSGASRRWPRGHPRGGSRARWGRIVAAVKSSSKEKVDVSILNTSTEPFFQA